MSDHDGVKGRVQRALTWIAGSSLLLFVAIVICILMVLGLM